MHPLIKKLTNNGPAVTDGSWGTQLQQRGLKRGECPDSWNLSQPDAVEEVARQYVEAGSQIILTNTFGGNRLSLRRFDLGDKAVAINTAGVEISKKILSEPIPSSIYRSRPNRCAIMKTVLV